MTELEDGIQPENEVLFAGSAASIVARMTTLARLVRVLTDDAGLGSSPRCDRLEQVPQLLFEINRRPRPHAWGVVDPPQVEAILLARSWAAFRIATRDGHLESFRIATSDRALRELPHRHTSLEVCELDGVAGGCHALMVEEGRGSMQATSVEGRGALSRSWEGGSKEATSVEALVFSALLVAGRIGDATWEDACVGELAALLVLEQHTCARHDEESRQDRSQGGGESVEAQAQQDRSEARDSSEVRPADFGVLWALLLELASAVASSTHAHARSLLHHEASLHKFHEAADMMRASAIEQVHSAAAALSLGPCPACLRAKAGGGGVTLGGGGCVTGALARR